MDWPPSEADRRSAQPAQVKISLGLHLIVHFILKNLNNYVTTFGKEEKAA